MAVRDAIELLAESFARNNIEFDIEVALWGLSYRFPSMTRDELRNAVLDALGNKALPQRKPVTPQFVTYRSKANHQSVRRQVTWERKAG